MEEQCYWIEINFPLFRFWGTAFKLWGESKRTARKLFEKAKFIALEIAWKRKIREPT